VILNADGMLRELQERALAGRIFQMVGAAAVRMSLAALRGQHDGFVPFLGSVPVTFVFFLLLF